MPSLPKVHKPMGVQSRREQRRAYDARRAVIMPWRKLYYTKRWLHLRLDVFETALYVCQQTGVLLHGGAHAPNSPVCDHIREHKGDLDLFWDINNLQCVSKQWHDSVKQREDNEMRAFNQRLSEGVSDDVSAALSAGVRRSL